MQPILSTQSLTTYLTDWDRMRDLSLRGIEDGGVGQSWRIAGVRCSIGTHESNDIVLCDPMVSRFHCEIQVEASAVRVTDLNSKNGTFIDGVRIRDAYLREDGQLRLGRSVMQLKASDTTSPLHISTRNDFGPLVGHSVAMRSLFDVLERASASNATILLEGETGSGKGLTAETIHQYSPRQNMPFVVVDCAAMPANLLESELFGHERGAFTGAVARHIGAFEAANGGTIFLDEIGELPLQLQPKLLRIIEQPQIRRIGGNSGKELDVRIIAATNRDLRTEVNEGRFRSDLYYRLALIRIRIPALREHPEDIPLLVDRLIAASHNVSEATAAMLRDPSFITTLQRGRWPGNVRELRNYLEGCLVLRQLRPIDAELDAERTDLSLRAPSAFDPKLLYHEARLRFLTNWEADYLRGLLSQYGNVDRAAAGAGISRAYLYRLLGRHGIRRDT